jgi:hypothetical protein
VAVTVGWAGLVRRALSLLRTMIVPFQGRCIPAQRIASLFQLDRKRHVLAVGSCRSELESVPGYQATAPLYSVK